ncbi:hypothetical protein [Ekhidna sp.]
MKNNLKHYIFEVLAIFIGITGSFLVEDYRINKIKADQVKYALEALNESLESDSINLAFNMVAYDSQISILSTWRNDNFDITPDTNIYMHFLALTASIPFSVDKTGYEIFIETEGKEQINNLELRKLISNYYNNMASIMESDVLSEQDYQNALMNLSLSANIEFPPKSLTSNEGLYKTYLPYKRYLNSNHEARNRLANQQILQISNKIKTERMLGYTIRLKEEIIKELAVSD